MRVRRQIGISLLLAGLALGLAGTANAATTPQGSSLSPREASRALERATRLFAPLRDASASSEGGERDSQRPAHLTPVLLQLSRALPSLGPAQRRRARALLARPTEPQDPQGNSYLVAEQPPFCTAHFCVHFVASSVDAPDLSDANGNGVPDHVEQVAATAETAYAGENVNLGWTAPKSDGALGGDSRTDIYLLQLAGEAFGYTATDPGQRTRSQFSYLVLDDDYSPAEFPGRSPLEFLQVTFAHEYNHVLQYSYDAAQDLWFYEASAVWIEDHVYPAINDYLRYIGRWVTRSKLPLTRENIKIYGSAVWNHWLAGRFGAAVVRNAWERARNIKPVGFSIDAYNSAIRRAGGSGFAREFVRFAAATAEWRTPGVFPYVDAPLWGDVKRRGKLRPGRFLVRRLSHTGFMLLGVKPRNVRAMRLLAGAQRGTKSAFGVVCRQGPVGAGEVRTKLRFTKRGGVRGLTLRNPGRCSRITVVLANADTRQVGFAFGDWLYTDDHKRFAATLVLRR
jgi:hypothetical protein